MLLTSSLIISFIMIKLTQRYFLTNNYIDKINNRSSHSSMATRSGGISIFLTIFLISIYFYIVGYEIFKFSLLIPLSLLVLVGLYDDINGVDFKLKFIFQIIAAKIIIDNGLIIDNLHGFAGVYEISRILAQLLTVFIIVAIINSINFIDGIDGLALIVVIIFIISFELFSISITPFKAISTIIVPSLIILSFFNFKKENKVFLGDSGSLFLGGIASIYIVYILSNDYIIKYQYDLHKILFIISIFSYPIIDIIRIVSIRIFNGKSPFHPDKNHIHHNLLKLKNNHFFISFLICGFSIFIMILFQLLFE